MKQLAIIGASGHGKVVADIAAKMGKTGKTKYDKIVFLDDDETIKYCGGYPVIGKSSIAKNCGCDVFVAIGNTKTRQRIQEELERAGVVVPTLIHPNAVIADDVVIGIGTVVMAGAVINPGSVIGKGCIINTCSSVDHDCIINDYVHVSVGTHLGGTVEAGAGTWIGAGSTVSNNVCICSDCMIGAGAVVVKDINEPDTYIGVPAKKLSKD